jgi:hypothetical protein
MLDPSLCIGFPESSPFFLLSSVDGFIFSHSFKNHSITGVGPFLDLSISFFISSCIVLNSSREKNFL